MLLPRISGFLVSLLMLEAFWSADASLAAMSVDFGHEFIKIALVKPGVPMEIVLNRESHRKTPALVTIREKDRHFGEQGANLAVRFPYYSFNYLPDLLGKKLEHPLVSLHDFRFMHHTWPDRDRETIWFHATQTDKYPVEEVVAMLLSDCKYLTEKFAEQPVKDVVITVPPYFNQAERRAMALAAELAGLNLLQLMNDNTAVALNYGIFRRKEFNETATTLLIYDMGAWKTTATVVEYKVVKDKQTKESYPELTVLGVGYNRTLGGVEMSMRLRNYMADTFMKENKRDLHDLGDLRNDQKGMAKFMKEANRVKKVLSANADHTAYIESPYQNIVEFKTKITRELFESLNEDLWDKIATPVFDALKMAELTVDQIDTVMLFGGGTRVPKVQEKLQQALKGKEIGKSLNTDEAAALGAVYQAAELSKGFKVKKFGIKDLILHPIQVNFLKEENGTQADSTKPRMLHRVLFPFKSHYPNKKLMSFSKHTHDFDLFVKYGDITYLNADQQAYISSLGSLNISRVEVAGVQEAIAKHTADGKEEDYKGVKVHFRVDASGILVVDSADATFDKVSTGKADAEEEQSTLSKLGSKISSFFSGGDKEDEKKPEDEKKGTEDSEKEKSTNDKETATDEASKDKTDEKEKATKDENKGEGSPPSAVPNTTDASKNETIKKDDKLKTIVVKHPLKLTQEYLDIKNITDAWVSESRKRLKWFDDYENEKRATEAAQNALETFVIDMGIKLEEAEFMTVTTEDDRAPVQEKLRENSAWLEEQTIFTPRKEFEDRLKALKDITKDMFYKFEEVKERPKIDEAMRQLLNYSNVILTTMRNMSETFSFTEVELTTLEKAIADTEKWYKDILTEQGKLKSHDMPVLTMKGAAEKMASLDREVKYLLNKAKFAKPKAKPKEKNETQANASESEPGDETVVDADKDEKDQPSDESENTASNVPEQEPLELPEAEDQDTRKNKVDDEL